LAIQQVTGEVAAEHPEWPRFRVGVNTGEAAVGLLGTAGGRTFTVIGDAVNLAARLEGAASVGEVLVGAETARRLPTARTEALGPVQVKGKAESVEVYRLVDL
jgi:class 3 adenylate cyclase